MFEVVADYSGFLHQGGQRLDLTDSCLTSCYKSP